MLFKPKQLFRVLRKDALFTNRVKYHLSFWISNLINTKTKICFVLCFNLLSDQNGAVSDSAEIYIS